MSMTKMELSTFFNLELDLVLLELTKEIINLRIRLMIDVTVVMELKQQNIFCSRNFIIFSQSYYLFSNP